MGIINNLKQTNRWIRVEYNNPEVIITENGWAEKEIVDVGRVSYLRVSKCRNNN